MGPKLRLLLDETHGEQTGIYTELIKLLVERCHVTALTEKLPGMHILTENSVFMLIGPEKPWREDEIEQVRRYVEDCGGILVAMTIASTYQEHLNKLLAPFGFTVNQDEVKGKNLDRENLEGPSLVNGVDSLAAGSVWLFGSTTIAPSDQAEVLLKYKDAIMGAKRSQGKGTVYLFSCLPVLGNKQLKQDGNRRFLENMLESLETQAAKEPVKTVSLREDLAAQDKAPPTAQKCTVYFRNPLPEVAGGVQSTQKWDQEGGGWIAWSEQGLDIEGSSQLSAAEEVASLGPIGRIFIRTAFESLRNRKVHVAIEEINKVVIVPLPEAGSGLAHIFTKKSDGSQDIYCLYFPENVDPRTSWPPLLLFQEWLTKNLPADKLETQVKSDKPESTSFRMPVEDVFEMKGQGIVAMGRVQQGVVRLGDKVRISGAKGERNDTVVGLEMPGKDLSQAVAGDAVGVRLGKLGKEDVQRGDIITGSGENQGVLK